MHLPEMMFGGWANPADKRGKTEPNSAIFLEFGTNLIYYLKLLSSGGNPATLPGLTATPPSAGPPYLSGNDVMFPSQSGTLKEAR
ncbi:D-aminoacyl-tRNA deacylase [Clarias magur]|uniref:D-aminoacyl-tRNA deacylase n=1 Tax=Clarias magur TaxID=1594786 RepID=A0A8J4XFF1_CLAMG|nr:D-aminoacyl-tRNA deacylase [Clarias magur]